MVKLVFCLRRTDGMTQAEFLRYWHETHAALVARHAETLRIRRYVQLHPTAPDLSLGLARSRRSPEPFDGVAELWFDSEADIEGAKHDHAARRALAELVEDEARFIDLERSPIWLVREETVLDASPGRSSTLPS